MRLNTWRELYHKFTSEAAGTLEHLEAAVLDSEATLLLTHATGTSRVYDIGTGAGRIPLFLRRQGCRGEIHGIEANEKMIAQAQRVSDDRTFFHHADALDWLKRADVADLILCMGNTIGGFMGQGYRHALFRTISERLSENGHLIVDYRDKAIVYHDETVLGVKHQTDGDLIVTAETLNGKPVRLCQFYPDPERLFAELSLSGLRQVLTTDLTGANYPRQVSVFRGESA